MRFFRSYIILLLFFGCSTKNSSQDRNGFLERFSAGVLEDAFSSYELPKNEGIFSEKTRTIVYPSSIYVSGYCGVFSFYKYKKSDYDELITALKSKSKYESLVYDTCNRYVYKSAIINVYCSDSYLPVPSFLDTLNSLEEKNMSNSRNKFLVFDSKPGNFIKESAEVDISLSADLGGKWKEGYSNGVIINDETNQVVFWIIFW